MDDDFDFDDVDFGDLEPDERDPDEPPPEPDYRATVVGGRVTVIVWNRQLMVGPAARPLFDDREAAGVTVADLSVVGDAEDRELVVRYLVRGGGAEAERALAGWAACTGHRRLWLPDRVVTLEPPRRYRPAATTCSNCGMVWREGEPEFWAGVQRAGLFPNYCLVCGGDLPQWTMAPKNARAR